MIVFIPGLDEEVEVDLNSNSAKVFQFLPDKGQTIPFFNMISSRPTVAQSDTQIKYSIKNFVSLVVFPPNNTSNDGE